MGLISSSTASMTSMVGVSASSASVKGSSNAVNSTLGTSANAAQTTGQSVTKASEAIGTSFTNASTRFEVSSGRFTNSINRMTNKIFGQEPKTFNPNILCIEDTELIRSKLTEIKNQCPNEFTQSELVHPEMCDIIEFERDLFSEFGIHTGSRKVVYLKKGETSNIYRFERDTIDNVAAGKLCRVNNLDMAAHRRELKAMDENEILQKAFKKLNMNARYHLIQYNSETFVTECKYDSGFSEQITVLDQ